MIIETVPALAYLLNMILKFNREIRHDPDQWEKFGREVITSRPDIFHSYDEKILPTASKEIILFFLGEPNKFDQILEDVKTNVLNENSHD
jgi:hypothetical protein